MSEFRGDFDIDEVLQRFDRTSADALLRSIASEVVRLSLANASLQARVAALEALMATNDRILAEGGGAEADYPSRFHISAEDSVTDAVGLFELEYDQSGRAFRWTGPERHFSFAFFLDRRRPANFSLLVDRHPAGPAPEELICQGDGERLATSVARTAQGYEIGGVLPARATGGGSVLTFLSPKMAALGADQAPNKRQVGVAFRNLSAQSAPER